MRFSTKFAVAACSSVLFAASAHAADITGAGATFPAPIYAKWADAYQKATGNRVNYQSIGSGGGIRQIGAKTVEPCKPEVASRHSGYLVGGTSPFGTRREMPVYVEESILALPRIAINGGRRGYLVGIDPQVCTTVLGARPVQCALEA